MPYDPEHHHRRSTRLPGFDYTQPAVYFLTLCTHNGDCPFGMVRAGVMQLNEIGRVVDEEWRRSEARRREIRLDAFVVMPNHVHGIVVIVPSDADPQGDHTDPRGYRLDVHGLANPTVGAQGLAPLRRPPKSVGSFVAGFKMAATKHINALRGTPGVPVWQRGYWDRILRDEREWHAVRRYIELNPARWEEDKNNPYR